MLVMTVFVGVVAGPVAESIVVGVEIKVLKRGPLVTASGLYRLVKTVPRALGSVVLRLGRLCAVPRVVDIIEIDILGITVDVLTDDMPADPKNIPSGVCVGKILGTGTLGATLVVLRDDMLADAETNSPCDCFVLQTVTCVLREARTIVC